MIRKFALEWHYVSHVQHPCVVCWCIDGKFANSGLHRSQSTRQDGRINRASVSHFGRSGEFRSHGFEHWSIQTNVLEMYIYRFLARHPALLGWGKDWLAQCQDNVTELGIRSWCCWLGLPAGSSIKSPWMRTVTRWYPSWYDLRCC